ncbi:muscle M-line assembly protein unc-89 [Spatholobus suberectus]|nr:muscle M-line assembly protein unc-89 [Spatholobus suberectus]
MAEESTINQMKSEKIEPEDADEKANPNVRLTVAKVPPRILSRYLSGPRGSCHDLCKYGIQHAVEAKPWSPTHKRVTKKERKSKVPEENVTSLAGTKKSGSSSKPSQTSKTEKVNSPVDIKEVTYEKEVTSEKNSPPFEETDVSSDHNNSDLKLTQSESSLTVQEYSKSQTKREIVKNKTPSSSSRKETESRSKQTRKSSTGGKEKPTPPSLPLSSKHNLKKPQSLSSKSTKNMKRESSLKPHENVEEVKPELASSDNLPDKILHVTEPASANSSEDPTLACDATKLSSSSPSSLVDKSLKHTNKNTGKSAVSASSKKGLGSVAGNKGKVNMLHKTRSVSRPSSVSSSVSSSNSSLRKQNNATSKSNKTGHDHQGENVRVGYKIRPKMSTKVGAANKVVAARKLTFRRGKVIELQPQSNNIPRRLKFRPARILGDDMRRDINGARKRTIMDDKVGGGEVNAANTKSEKVVAKLQTVEGSKRRSVGRKVGGDRSKIEGSKSGSDEKVVLRHQNVEGKKKNPRLYNNVIEETASMLAELRKSKVKALVGAFETVISLDSPREATAAEVSTAC